MTDYKNLTTFCIRYDGLDAGQHQLSLSELGLSLQGLSRLLGVAGHFALTGKYAKKAKSFDVRVLAEGKLRANCLSIDVILQFAQQHGILQGSLGVIMAALISWIVAKSSGKAKEMKMLKDTLDTVIKEMAQGNEKMRQALLQTIETIVLKEKSALQRAVEPVGRTCSSMRIGDMPAIDTMDAEIIRSGSAGEIGQEASYELKFTEIDIESKSGKVRFGGDEKEGRIPVSITDPAFIMQHNIYMDSFAQGRYINVRAKSIIKDGNIFRLYISNASEVE